MKRIDVLRKELARVNHKIRLEEKRLHQTGYDDSYEEVYADDIYRREAKIKSGRGVLTSRWNHGNLFEIIVDIYY